MSQDFGMDHWPEAVRNTYGQMQLPSLYEMVLANEKLAVEIRKQNREIRLLREKIDQRQEEQHLKEQMENEEKRNEVKEIEKVLITLMDSIFQLSSASKKTMRNLMSILPAKEGWRRRTPTWRGQAEKILVSYDDGVGMIQNKLQGFFDDLSITPIIPQNGDPFSPKLHRAVEQCSGAPSGAIAEVFRIGYQLKGKLIRCADVKTYS